MPGALLSLPEREEISFALIEDPGSTWVSISRRVGRHPTTIAREVAGNGGRLKYRPATADRGAHKARRRPRLLLLRVDGPLRTRVAAELGQGRSPEAIWADLRAEEAPVVPCVETIYQAVYTGALGVKATDCLRMRRPRRQYRQARHANKKAGLPNIGGRPKAIENRAEVGRVRARDVDGDAGAVGQGAVSGDLSALVPGEGAAQEPAPAPTLPQTPPRPWRDHNQGLGPRRSDCSPRSAPGPKSPLGAAKSATSKAT